MIADEVCPHEPRRTLGVVTDLGEERAEVGAAGMRVERLDVRVDLVQIEEVRVLFVRQNLKSARARLVREGVARGLLGRPDEVVTVLGLDGEGNGELIHRNSLLLRGEAGSVCCHPTATAGTVQSLNQPTVAHYWFSE